MTYIEPDTPNGAPEIEPPATPEPDIQPGQTDIPIPEVLMHLVPHHDGSHDHHGPENPSPDDDYIVGGTGVVKALQYCLGEKAQDRHGAQGSGMSTPVDEHSNGLDSGKTGKAKEMSKNLLGSARKVRARLQPALQKEASTGDELAYRRLLFLDQTLAGMIQRFEDEYPETRLFPPSPKQSASVASSQEYSTFSDTTAATSITPYQNEASLLQDSDDDEFHTALRPSRRNSDVNLANRALAQEEGRIHRLGITIRRDIMNASPGDSPSRRVSIAPDGSATDQGTDSHISELTRRLWDLPGLEAKQLVERAGWDGVMEKVHANMDDLRLMHESDPVEWEQFRESQMKALANVEGDQWRR